MNFIEPADYSEGSDLDNTVKLILSKMAMVNDLTQKTKTQLGKIGKT